MAYLRSRREALGGPVPERRSRAAPLREVPAEPFTELHAGTGGREASLTMGFARLLSRLLRDPVVGELIVPIVPDEARTFGMESLFRQVGIYAHAGQLYEPVDHATLLYYREGEDGQIIEEGITEAGSMSSFIAAGTAYATHAASTPSRSSSSTRCSGLQRVGDLIWAAADSRCRGFLVGGTAGRTTLAGEGLQHQDGQSHLLASPVPNLLAYDPAYAYELAVIVEDGIRRMYRRRRERVLLPDGRERGLSDAGDARRGARGHPAGAVPAAAGPRAAEAPGAASRQRGDTARGPRGPDAAGCATTWRPTCGA